MNHKTIGVVYDLEKDFVPNKGDPPDAKSEFDTPEIIASVAGAISHAGFKPIRIGNYTRLLKPVFLNKSKFSFDLIFSIAEGYSGRNREAQVPVLLESMGIPYIGSDGLTLSLSLDKLMTKKIFFAENIPTPNYISSDLPVDTKIIRKLNFPLIVKPRWEGSSKGIDRSSKVTDLSHLNKQISYIVKKYHQPAIIEEFIKGREFTALIIGNISPRVMPIIEMQIRGKPILNNYYLNRQVYTDEISYACPAKIPESLKNKLTKLAIKAYHVLDCLDFARVDFRTDLNDNIYVLEINPLPGLSEKDAFGAISKATGISYNGLIGEVIHSACQRYDIS